MDLFWEEGEEEKGQQGKRFYLSDADSAQNEKLLCKNDIQAVVSIGADIMLPFSSFIRAHVFIPLLDLPTEDIISTNKMELGWIFSQNTYGNLLLHCQLGHSRSACMAVYFLMRIHGWPLTKCFLIVHRARPSIMINNGFLGQLRILWYAIGAGGTLQERDAALAMMRWFRLAHKPLSLPLWPYVTSPLYTTRVDAGVFTTRNDVGKYTRFDCSNFETAAKSDPLSTTLKYCFACRKCRRSTSFQTSSVIPHRASTISESHTHMLCVHLLNNLSDVFVSELSLFIKKRGYFDDNSGDSSSAPPPSKLDAPLALEKFGCNTCTSIFLEPTHHCLNSWEKNMPVRSWESFLPLMH